MKFRIGFALVVAVAFVIWAIHVDSDWVKGIMTFPVIAGFIFMVLQVIFDD